MTADSLEPVAWAEMEDGKVKAAWTKQYQPFFEPLYSAAQIAALRAELAKYEALATDPVAVRANLLAGRLAKPADLVWLHETNGPVAELRAENERLRAQIQAMHDNGLGESWVDQMDATRAENERLKDLLERIIDNGSTCEADVREYEKLRNETPQPDRGGK